MQANWGSDHRCGEAKEVTAHTHPTEPAICSSCVKGVGATASGKELTDVSATNGLNRAGSSGADRGLALPG